MKLNLSMKQQYIHTLQSLPWPVLHLFSPTKQTCSCSYNTYALFRVIMHTKTLNVLKCITTSISALDQGWMNNYRTVCISQNVNMTCMLSIHVICLLAPHSLRRLTVYTWHQRLNTPFVPPLPQTTQRTPTVGHHMTCSSIRLGPHLYHPERTKACHLAIIKRCYGEELNKYVN